MSQLIPPLFSSGVATARTPADLFGRFPKPFMIPANYYENDFNTYLASDWTIIATGGGTNALTNALGGALLLTTGGTNGNQQAIQLATQSFAFTPGYQTWFSINLLMTTLVPNIIVGLIAGTSAVPTSGVYFTRATTSANINAVINKAGTSTTLTAVTTMAANTAISLGIYYDGKPTSNLYFYSSTGLTGATVATPSPTAFGSPPIYGGARVASASNDGLNPNVLTNLPTALLAPSAFVQTNATATATMQLDYIIATSELSRF
jgi:hypothetical protein